MHDHNQKGLLHKIAMALCIGAPVAGVLLFLLSRAGVISFGGTMLPYLLFLLCPLSHLLMMPMMAKAMQKNENNTQAVAEQKHTGCH